MWKELPEGDSDVTAAERVVAARSGEELRSARGGAAEGLRNKL
jgi:hypothetical protein